MTRRNAGTRRTVAARAACVALAVTLLGSAAACSRGEAPTDTASSVPFAQPVTIENCGRTETFDAPPQRIVSMNRHVTETLIQLGVGDRIVGMAQDDQKDPLPEVVGQLAKIPSLSKEYPPAEKVLDLQPDFVVAGMSSAFSDKSGLSRDALESSGIRTFLFSEYCGDGFSDISVLEDDFTDLGRVLGVEPAAQALIDRIVGGLDAVSGLLDAAGVEPVRTFFYDMGEEQPTTIGSAGIGNLIAQYTRAENIAPDQSKPFYKTTWETVGDRAPDAIVVDNFDMTGTADGDRKIDFLKNQPIMQTTPAVRNDRFVMVPLSNMFESTRMVMAAETIARGLHPEAFTDNE
ncbi:ABC transporter substrate-binding protein [Tomitella cavernea]|uniref:ABC transporter substrate-binding protein n=1 Tax=Tomitella cavernea TaxID=1387982 RepID=A0ABP9D355_9ACTN|nr:ABC transporter substrate-binding protein [Tomitella cavernea]